jgi:hypothetical protein
MLMQTLFQVTVLTYFAISSGHGLNLDAEKAHAPSVDEKIVLRQSPLSEQYGLGLETVVRPDTEIAALQADASRFQSVLGLLQRAATAAQTKRAVQTVRMDWSKRFSLSWDDDGGFDFGGKKFPYSEHDQIYSFQISFQH